MVACVGALCYASMNSDTMPVSENAFDGYGKRLLVGHPVELERGGGRGRKLERTEVEGELNDSDEEKEEDHGRNLYGMVDVKRGGLGRKLEKSEEGQLNSPD